MHTTFYCSIFGHHLADADSDFITTAIESRAENLFTLGCTWPGIADSLANDAARLLGLPAQAVRLELDTDEHAAERGEEVLLIAVLVMSELTD